MPKKWSRILQSLPHSQRIRALPDAAHKWAYVCIQCSNFGNFHGQFFYPVQALAMDVPTDPDTAREMIDALTDAGLIEYDHDEQYVRLTGYHSKGNPPDNPSTVTNRCREFADLSGPAGMTIATIAEFMVGAFRKSAGWRPDTQQFLEMEKQLIKTLDQSLRRYGDDVVTAILDAGLNENDERLMDELQLRVADWDTVSAPWLHRGAIKIREREEKRMIREETEKRGEEKREYARDKPRVARKRSDALAPKRGARSDRPNGKGHATSATDSPADGDVAKQVSTRGGIPGHVWVDDLSLAEMVEAGKIGATTAVAYENLRRQAQQ